MKITRQILRVWNSKQLMKAILAGHIQEIEDVLTGKA